MSEVTAKDICDAGRTRQGAMRQFLTSRTRFVRPEPVSKEEG